MDNDQNYTITYSTFVVRFLLLEIQKKNQELRIGEVSLAKAAKKIQFRKQKVGSTFHYQTLLKTRLII